MRSFPVAMKPKVDLGYLATNLLPQAGADRQVFGCGEGCEDNGLVGEIAVFNVCFSTANCVWEFSNRSLSVLIWFSSSNRRSLRATAGAERVDQSVDQNLDLGFRSTDGETQFGYLLLALSNAFAIRNIDHGGPIESIEPCQKSFLEVGVGKKIGCRSFHILGIGPQPGAIALAFITVVHWKTKVGVPDQTGEEIVEGAGAAGKLAGYLSSGSDGDPAGDGFVRSIPKFRGDDGRIKARAQFSFGLAAARLSFCAVGIHPGQGGAIKKNLLNIRLAPSACSAKWRHLLFVQSAGNKPFSRTRRGHLENSLNHLWPWPC